VLLLGAMAMLAGGRELRAQEPVRSDSMSPAAAASLDLQAQSTPQDSVRPPVSPMGAFLRSFLVPGWGQAAADQPVRGAFYFGAQAGTVFMLIKTQTKLRNAERAVPQDTALVRARKDQREDWIALAAFWALFSGIDAWVSAQFWDFEGPLVPPPDGGVGVGVKIPVDPGF
jgi:hypothetical protein